MARAALGWSAHDLATRAAVSENSVRRAERGDEISRAMLQLLRLTLEAAGVRFGEDGSVTPPAEG